MTVRIKKRIAVRIAAYSAAALAVAVVFAVTGWVGYMKERQKSEYSYQRALLSLSESIDSIDITLKKSLCAGSAEQFAALASKLYSDSAAAKSELSQLPSAIGELDNVNRFISHVGNYAGSLAKKRYLDEDLTDEELHQLKELEKYTAKLKLMLDEIMARSADSGMWPGYSETILDFEINNEKSPQSSASVDVMADDFTDYPALIYDGPFSDHIYENKPMLIKNDVRVSKEKALETARRFSNDDSIGYIRSVEGNLPMYVFGGRNTEVGVSVQGGRMVYLINSRQVGDSKIDADKAEEIAELYLKERGFGEMSSHYYEIYSDCCLMNFTCVENGVVMYPDMIKVTVALDNGEVVELDARDYVMNHHARGSLSASVDRSEAEKIVSRHLETENAQLAVIPTDGRNEALCWEFLCDGEDDTEVLVYINADNLREEKILLILEDEEGRLTI